MASFIIGIIISLTSLVLLSAIYIPYFLIAAKQSKLPPIFRGADFKKAKILTMYVISMYGIAFILGFLGLLNFAKFFVISGFIVGLIGGLWGLIHLLIRATGSKE